MVTMSLVGVSYKRPSILVLLAEHSFNLTFRNAAKFLIQFLKQHYSHRIGRLGDKVDELFCILDLLVQWFYLSRWNASFTEHFFSLQRFNLAQNSNGKLNGKNIFLSMIQLCVTPYIADKLESYYRQVSEKHLDNEQNGQNLFHLTKVDQLLLQFYPTVKQFVQLLQVFTWVSYAVDNDHVHDISIWTILGKSVRLGHMNNNISLSGNTSLLAIGLSKFLESSLKGSAFLIQFLEYWYSKTDIRQINSLKLNTSIPPPPCSPFLTAKNRLTISPELCPLCLQKKENETALSSSGYVFCYACIHSYVSKEKRCPVTGFPSTLEQLVRVFD